MSIFLHLIIPIASGFLFFVLGVVLPDEIQGELALGAIGVLVAVIVEMILRLIRKEASRDATSNLLRRLDDLPKESYPFALEMLKQYVRATNSTEHPVYKDALRTHALNSADWLRRVSSGELEVGAGRIELLEEGVQTCKRSIRGITVASLDLGWWRSEHGIGYWKENVAAIKNRQVEIHRIFIDGFGLSEAQRNDLKDLIAEQRAEGVTTFFAEIDKLTSVINDPGRDITIFDDHLVHEVSAVIDGHPTRVTYRRGQDAVREANEHFLKVRNRASRLAP
ncbi:hypothetical protein GCM10009557_40490 [Virgisporangium ochraceum]|uniref:Uncharacterized protein n=1 Tax=Virgisporangium ochraceum TaxID=65505 RepID=A0A8J4EJI1_9ACTN|nr:hypothetical protein [Virgisporangium ochraceum]GIJ74337.1 hypothetical protein Voc01_092540 [Virgisporangium ochraceum]